MIDRHAFASNVSSFDTAWRTFGWTPGVRARVSTLEEDVPWATVAASTDNPARLRGRVGEVLHPDNYDALQFAFLPLDGRLGFSVWGALERVNGAPEWRVLTHTLLFDRASFDHMAGFPFALLRDSRHAAWFGLMVEHTAFAEPTELAPLPVPDERERSTFEQARLREVQRLTDRLLASFHGDATLLQDRLAATYEALAAAHQGTRVRRVALRSRGSLTESLLTRLAWITLPLEDRAHVFFSTEQRRTAAPPATLFVLPEAEWGQFAPEATRVLDGGPADALRVAVGRRHWARAVANGVGLHARLMAAAELRGWQIIARDDVGRLEGIYRWRRRCREQGITFDAVRELIALELKSSAGRARIHWRALGHVLARAVQHERLDPADGAQRSLALLPEVPEFNRVMLLRATLRTLLRGRSEDRQTAGFIRLGAASGEVAVPLEELLRLMDVEQRVIPDLLEHPDGGTALFRGGTLLAVQGHLEGERLGMQAWAKVRDPLSVLRDALSHGKPNDSRVRRWADTVLELLLASAQDGVLERVIREMDAHWLAQDDVLPRLLHAVADMSSDRASAAAGQLLDRLLADPAFNGSPDAGAAAEHAGGNAGAAWFPLPDSRIETVLRLAWLEARGGVRAGALERYADADPARALPLLVQLLCSTPPLPLFLRLRRFLLRTPAAQFPREAIAGWLNALEDHCPALHAQLASASTPTIRTLPKEWKRSASAVMAR